MKKKRYSDEQIVRILREADQSVFKKSLSVIFGENFALNRGKISPKSAGKMGKMRVSMVNSAMSACLRNGLGKSRHFGGDYFKECFPEIITFIKECLGKI